MSVSDSDSNEIDEMNMELNSNGGDSSQDIERDEANQTMKNYKNKLNE